MIKYKLKKEARPFFKSDMATLIKPIDFWQKEMVHINLLEKVDNVHIVYGIKTGENSTSLQGWDSSFGNPKAHFHFTVNVSDISNDNYDRVSIPDMMDEMQKVINKYMTRYVDSE